MAPSCKLRFARFSAGLKFQDGAECGNYTITAFAAGMGLAVMRFDLVSNEFGATPIGSACSLLGPILNPSKSLEINIFLLFV